MGIIGIRTIHKGVSMDMEKEVANGNGQKIDPEEFGRRLQGESSSERMMKLFMEEFIPLAKEALFEQKRLTELNKIQNALKDARLVGDNDLAKGLAGVLLKKFAE